MLYALARCHGYCSQRRLNWAVIAAFESAMHLRPRAIAPGIPLVSISVSFVALRLLSWAEPKVLTGKSGDASAFAGPSLGNRRQHSRSKGLRLFPWAQAVPLDLPMAQSAPPNVVDDMLKRDADVASRTSGELSDRTAVVRFILLYRYVVPEGICVRTRYRLLILRNSTKYS